MSVSAEDFLDSAKTLASSSTAEIGYRNAISRAYYACLHLARQHFPPDESKFSQGVGVHKNYVNQLIAHEDGLARLIGLKLNSMRTRRVEADYFCNNDVSQKQVTDQIINAQRLFEKVTSNNRSAAEA